MAAPLFVADLETLLKKLRLSSVPDSALDSLSIIDEAVLRARVRFYRDLGTARTNELVALAFTETPTDDDGISRALANTVEVRMVYCELLRLLPNTFMDSSGDADERWNEEAPLRERGGGALEDELRHCENQIVSDLLALADDSLDECDEAQVFDGTADCPAPRVGMSLKNFGRRSTSED